VTKNIRLFAGGILYWWGYNISTPVTHDSSALLAPLHKNQTAIDAGGYSTRRLLYFQLMSARPRVHRFRHLARRIKLWPF